MPTPAEKPAAAAAVVARCEAPCRRTLAFLHYRGQVSRGRCPTVLSAARPGSCPDKQALRRSVMSTWLSTAAEGRLRQRSKKLSHAELFPDITAERDGYAAVPPRPATAEAPDHELSHSEAIPDITAERDEYVAVPSRPGSVEAAGEKLSHSETISGHHGGA